MLSFVSCHSASPGGQRNTPTRSAGVLETLTERSYACPAAPLRCPAVRLIVARCEVSYSGRLTARLPEALRLLMVKADGSVLVHDTPSARGRVLRGPGQLRAAVPREVARGPPDRRGAADGPQAGLAVEPGDLPNAGEGRAVAEGAVGA